MVGLPEENFRTVRGYQLQSRGGGQLTPALEDYLEMVYRLCMQSGYARVGKLSELLHVKPSSASKMISKLTQLGFVEYDRYELILLAEKGRQSGEYLLKRHDTIECFLKLLGCENALEETELIEHSLSASTVSALGCLLDYFQSDSSLLSGFSRRLRQWNAAE
jgi:Mn-dependent DtxR family transcriptional regulator